MAQQGEAREEVQTSAGRGAGGRAKQLKEAEEDVGGEEVEVEQELPELAKEREENRDGSEEGEE